MCEERLLGKIQRGWRGTIVKFLFQKDARNWRSRRSYPGIGTWYLQDDTADERRHPAGSSLKQALAPRFRSHVLTNFCDRCAGVRLRGVIPSGDTNRQ